MKLTYYQLIFLLKAFIVSDVLIFHKLVSLRDQNPNSTTSKLKNIHQLSLCVSDYLGIKNLIPVRVTTLSTLCELH